MFEFPNFFGNSKKKNRKRGAADLNDGTLPRLPAQPHRPDAKTIFTAGNNPWIKPCKPSYASTLSDSLQQAIAKKLYAVVRDNLQLLHADQLQIKDINQLQKSISLKVKIVDFLAFYESSAGSVRRELVDLNRLFDSACTLVKRSHHEYLAVAATGNLAEPRLLQNDLRQFDRDCARLLPDQPAGVFEKAALDLIHSPQGGRLKLLISLENQIRAVVPKLAAKCEMLLDGCRELVDSTVALCENLAEYERKHLAIPELVRRWRENFGKFYLKGSPETWLAEMRRNSHSNGLLENMRLSAGVHDLYEQAIDLDTQASKLAASPAANHRDLSSESEQMLAAGCLDQALVLAKAALHLEPSSSAAYLQQGRIYERSGSPALAFHAYRGALIAQPNELSAYRRLSKLCSGDNQKLRFLVDELRDIRRLCRNVFELDFQIILAQIALGDRQEAARGLTTMERNFPSYGDLRYCRGLLAKSCGDSAQAAEHFCAALKMEPHDFFQPQRKVSAALEYSEALKFGNSGKQGIAAEMFESLISIDPRNSKLFRALSWNSMPALILIPRFQRIADAVQSAEAYMALADLQIRAGRRDAAVRSLNRAIAIEPAALAPHEKLADLYGQLGNKRLELDCLMRAYRMCPIRSDLLEKIEAEIEQQPDLTTNLNIFADQEQQQDTSGEDLNPLRTESEAEPANLEQHSITSRGIELPPMLILRVTGDYDKLATLLAFDHAISNAPNEKTRQDNIELLRQLIIEDLIEEVPEFNDLLPITEPSSEINRLLQSAIIELQEARNITEHTLQTLTQSDTEGNATVSKEFWDRYSQSIHQFFDPLRSNKSLPCLIASFKPISEASRELCAWASIFAAINTACTDFTTGMKEASSLWQQLFTHFRTSPNINAADLREKVLAISAALGRSQACIDQQFLPAAKVLVENLDHWLDDNANFLIEICRQVQRQASRGSEASALHDQPPEGLDLANSCLPGINLSDPGKIADNTKEENDGYSSKGDTDVQLPA